MTTVFPGNSIPAPGYRVGNISVDDELLASTARFTQKGVTLAAGQGVLPLGTVLSRRTTDKRYVKYASGGSDGSQTPVGVLRQTVDTGSVTSTTDPTVHEFQNNVVMSGVLVASKVAAANGGSVASGVLTALGARVDAANDWFIF